MQLFVRVPGQPTVAVEIGSDGTMALLKQAIEDRTGIPAAEQLLTRGGRPLPASPSALPHGAALDLLLRLAGGKGGFGALLRGQGRDGKITDNFDACRDLQGRRVRQVEAEKKLKEWAAQSKERELEKIAQQHIRDLARQQRQERDYEINVEAVRNEQRAALERVQEAVQSALAEGLATGAPGGSSGSGSGASGSGASGSGASGSGGGSSDTEAGGVEAEGGAPGSAGAKRKAPEAAAATASSEGAEPVAAAAKRPRKGMLDMLDGSEDGDSSSDEEDE